MRCMFKDNIPLVELVLRILTGKPDLVIIDCQTQKDMKRLAGARSICLDAYGEDSSGKKYDIEIQREDRGAEPQRARYHSSVMDVENLDAGQKFSELPDTYTIFITEKDFYGMGKPVYSIERTIRETGKAFEDGAHILYVNGEYRGDSDIGRLMHDFNCTNAGEMNFELMAERTRYLKENPEGVSQMCKVIEEMRREEREAGMKEGLKEGLREGMKTAALRMLEAGKYALEDIAGISGLSLDEVKKLQAGQGM
ncbi:MAG: Rpn family recombination-promoting nuclease/putative transposase [Oscillibacter sp.]|nr:Rpn family recombination-promoting nuclease/putative transposase [Oscillibacter sp.]